MAGRRGGIQRPRNRILLPGEDPPEVRRRRREALLLVLIALALVVGYVFLRTR